MGTLSGEGIVIYFSCISPGTITLFAFNKETKTKLWCTAVPYFIVSYWERIRIGLHGFEYQSTVSNPGRAWQRMRVGNINSVIVSYFWRHVNTTEFYSWHLGLPSSSKDSHVDLNRNLVSFTGRLFHCHMLDESIFHFRGVGSISSLLLYLWWELLWENNEDPDQTPYIVGYDLGLHCLPMTFLRISRKQWVNVVYWGTCLSKMYEGCLKSFDFIFDCHIHLIFFQ